MKHYNGNVGRMDIHSNQQNQDQHLDKQARQIIDKSNSVTDMYYRSIPSSSIEVSKPGDHSITHGINQNNIQKNTPNAFKVPHNLNSGFFQQPQNQVQAKQMSHSQS
jgi:hypothetical protein